MGRYKDNSKIKVRQGSKVVFNWGYTENSREDKIGEIDEVTQSENRAYIWSDKKRYEAKLTDIKKRLRY